MRNKLFFLALLQVSLLMVSCGEKKQEAPAPDAATEEVTPNKDDASQTDAEMTEESEAAIDSKIDNIRKVWKSQSFEVEPGDITPGIHEFALAFCKQYPDYEPNECLSSYLISPSEYKEEKTGYHINDNKAKGFISASSMAQYTTASNFCYWKRKDDHRLFAAWLLEEFENGGDHALIAFYDYDVANDLMKPEPKLTQMVEDAMKGFDSYAVNLPIDGKNIELIGYKFTEEDSAEPTSYQMIWDGQTFQLKK